MKPLDELTTHCIRCGFCLESCPTFLITGEETESPRGRIYLVRSADEGKIDWEDTRPHLQRCLGCLACQTACPSGVEYGEIFEIARDRLERLRTHKTKKFLLKTLTSPPLTRLNLRLGRLAPGRKVPAPLSLLLSGHTAEADRPTPQRSNALPPLDEKTLPPIKGEVYLLEGCVMSVLFPRVHECTRRLLRRLGYAVKDVPQGCCGSLHLHAGYLDETRTRASRLLDAFPGDAPILVDSAGCGSTMKSYGELFAEPGEPSRRALLAQSFADRVQDISEFLLSKGLADLLPASAGIPATATYHDACHLAHGQGVRTPPRELLAKVPKLKTVPLEEPDTCCGSAGIYNLTQPEMARQLLERKWANIEKTGADLVVMGNPGCHAWLAQAAREHGGRARVLHTTELLEASFIGLDAFE